MEEPHVLILPFPAQGHIKPMLCLAQLLCHTGGIHVTFLNTHHNHRRLNNLQALSTRFPTLNFHSISDGLPDDDPRTLHRFLDLCSSIKSTTKPLFKDLLVSLNSNSSPRPPVSCIIADGIMSFAIDVATELGIKIIIFRTVSASCLWSYLCVPKLVQEGQLPFGDDDLDKMITGVGGMEGFLRRRDLPASCRSKAQLDDKALEFFVNETFAMTRASSLILNTFDDLEAPVLSEIARVVPNIYTIGPVHALLKSRVEGFSQSSTSNASLWEEDRSCMTWLDSQPSRSVVYVSFGSFVVLTRGQLSEFWHGLVNSGKRFLWTLRSDTESHEEMDSTRAQIQVGTKDRWCVVDWAPQEEVLAHQAVGGFLTHSGWNSTLEGIVAGVPLICWPQLADQTVNSRWISEIWRIGLDMKDKCDRSTVEKMVRALMEDQREEIMRLVDSFAGLARDSVSQGGSSDCNLEALIKELKRM